MEFFDTTISDAAIENAVACLRSTFLSEGQRVKAFENALSEQLGLVRPVALNSGTSALHLGLAVAGVGPGDEVILPPQTFVATGLALMMHGATPVFADIQADSGNISPESVRDKITSKTVAIMPVHWAGYPCDLDEIHAIAAEHGLAVIEDAAQALGATYRGKPIGSISRLTAFSFQAIKHLTTGDGGALCCLAEADQHAARCRRWFGIDRDASRPSELGEREYDIDAVGYKSHMNDLAAAIGLGNLKSCAEHLARRQEIGAFYRDELAGVSGLRLLRAGDDRTHAYWLFTMLVERRSDLTRRLREHGIPTSVVHLGIDRYTVFGGRREELPGQIEFDHSQLSIPMHGRLTDVETQHVVDTIRQGW